VIIFGTGHRPEDCNVLYSEMVFLIEDEFEKIRDSISVAVCGMAAGFDLAFGQAALSLDIPVWSVRPWAGHHPRRDDMEIYCELEKNAARHVITNDSMSYPGPWAYQKRNEWMVDNSDEGLSFWNGKLQGGTFNCLKYAKKTGTPVRNIYPENKDLRRTKG
jgi:hypothetical protein